jgi:hypothetical protein
MLTASRIAGGLLVLSAILGIAILGLDQVLQKYAPMHFYGLIILVIVDLAVGFLLSARPMRTYLTFAMAWGILRIIIQLADISQAQASGFSSYGQFADYLFNPMSSVSTQLGNLPGIPAALIDLIIVLDIVVAVVAWMGRSSKAA